MPARRGNLRRGSARSPLAGVLTRDPRSPATFYAGFALAQYEDLQQRAAPAGNLVAGPGWARTTGAVAVLVVLALGAIATALYLARRRHRARPDRKGAPAERGSLVRVRR